MSSSRRCGAVTASGYACRAWAVRDTNPPRCSSHAGRNVGAGAPKGNQNAQKHGYYDDTLSEQEIASLVRHVTNRTPDDEVGMVRTVLHRLMELAVDPDLPRSELYIIAKLLISGARAVAYMLHLSGATVEDIWEQILDELGEELGHPL